MTGSLAASVRAESLKPGVTQPAADRKPGKHQNCQVVVSSGSQDAGLQTGGVGSMNVFLMAFGGWKPPTWSHPVLERALTLPCRRLPSVWQRESSLVSLSFFVRMPALLNQLPLRLHLTFVTSSQALSPNIITLEMRASTYGFGGGHKHSVRDVPHPNRQI